MINQVPPNGLNIMLHTTIRFKEDPKNNNGECHERVPGSAPALRTNPVGLK